MQPVDTADKVALILLVLVLVGMIALGVQYENQKERMVFLETSLEFERDFNAVVYEDLIPLQEQMDRKLDRILLESDTVFVSQDDQGIVFPLWVSVVVGGVGFIFGMFLMGALAMSGQASRCEECVHKDIRDNA